MLDREVEIVRIGHEPIEKRGDRVLLAGDGCSGVATLERRDGILGFVVKANACALHSRYVVVRRIEWYGGPEVDEPNDAAGIDEHVARMNVTVKEASPVEVRVSRNDVAAKAAQCAPVSAPP